MGNKVRVGHRIGKSYVSYNVNNSKEASNAIISFELAELLAKAIVGILLFPLKAIVFILGALTGSSKRRR